MIDILPKTALVTNRYVIDLNEYYSCSLLPIRSIYVDHKNVRMTINRINWNQGLITGSEEFRDRTKHASISSSLALYGQLRLLMLEHSQALRSEQACVVHEGPPAHAYFKTLNQFPEKQYNTHKRIIVSHLLAREQNYVQYTPLKVRLFSMYSTYTHIFLHNHT